MTDKIKYLLISIAAILVLASCDSGGSFNAEEVEGAGYVLAGYYMMAGEETAISEGTSRATASTDVTRYTDYAGKTFADLDGTTMMFVNYPEQGQKTYVTVSEHSAGIYLMSSTTTYPNRDDVIDYYLEEYYLRSDTGDSTGVWTSGVVYNPDAATPGDDPTYRKTMEVHFQDGSVRYEWITDTSTTMDTYYSSFDIDGDMIIPGDEDWTPETQSSGMDYSSKVHYYQSVQADIGWFEVENKEIFGVRYYTEETGGDSTSLAYETMITQTVLQSWINNDSWIGSIATWLFGGGDDSDDTTLSETVIRYKLSGNNNKRTTRSYSQVVTSSNYLITIDLETEY